MAYSWEDTANEILKQKKIWNDATYEKNSSLADQAAKTAAGYYDTLRQNGDGALADALQSRDIVSAQKYFDTYKNNKNMVQGAYNRGDAIDSIVNQKKAWNDATYDKNTAFAGQAASNAQSIYNWMRDNGDEKTAQMLSNMDYTAAEKFRKDEAEKQGVVDNYDSKNALNLVMRLQTEADAANKRGDSQTANDLQWEVNRFLKLMGENGDGVLASNFNDRETNSQKQQYVEKYMNTTGKTALRNYLYQAGAKFGLSNADIDKMISYDNNTGEITLAGVNIGKPDAVVDGVSYVSAEKAEQLAKDAFNRAGVTMSDDDRYQSQIGAIDRANNAELDVRSRQREEMEKKGNELWDEGKKNVTDSTDYKRIYDRTMSQYNLAALSGRDNEAALRAASNSGNIDSYAAANAMRQQAAMTAYGQQVANELGLNAYQARLDNLGNIFDKLGIEYSRGNAEIGEQLDRMSKNAQQVFDNNETRKNNEVSRDVTIADMTGYVDPKYTLKNNPFFHSDGSLIDPNMDYQQYINEQRENLEKTTDPTERNRIQNNINNAMQAKAKKIASDPERWGQYANELEAVMPQNTFARDKSNMDYDTTLKSINSAERISLGEADAAQKAAQAAADAESDKAWLDYNSSIYKSDKDYDATVDSAKIKANSDVDVAAINANSKSDKNNAESNKVSDAVLNTYVNQLNNSMKEKYGDKLGDKAEAVHKWTENNKTFYSADEKFFEYITHQLINDKGLTDGQVEYIMSQLGIPSKWKDIVLDDAHYE